MEPRFYRNASGQLTLDLAREYPNLKSDGPAVKAMLASRFAASFGRRTEDPVGDWVDAEFSSNGHLFVLSAESMVGLHITAQTPAGEPLLHEMASSLRGSLPGNPLS